jgi:hypothetical protein
MPIVTIKAHPEICEVMIYKRGKTVWVATGEFQGEPLHITARTEIGAERQWKALAEARYRRS